MKAAFASEFSSFVDVLRHRAESAPEDRGYIFLRDGERDELFLSYRELDQQARAIATELRRRGVRQGDRVLLLYMPGLDFISGFFGCLYAGAMAVSCYPPDPTRLDRTLPPLQSIVRDSGARVVLTTRDLVDLSESLFERAPELRNLATVPTDEIPHTEVWLRPEITKATAALLQYTSGSTGSPKGVVVTHGNLLHNSELIFRTSEADDRSVVVGWLPLYHDMGLIGTVLHPCYAGVPAVLMSPLHFLQKPGRWLEAISRYRGTASPAPNFAYDLCVRKVTPEQRSRLDLGSWRVAINGAEPLRAKTFEDFSEAFGPCGFRRETFCPCYGLAEGTLIVSGLPNDESPMTLSFSKSGLERNRLEAVSETGRDALVLTSSGRVLGTQQLVIVDAASGVESANGEIGEIWLAGESVAAGYWGRQEETEQVFGARLLDGRGPFLRTGDLGCMVGRELFVTGRIKDLIIVRGMNYYPQDFEASAETAHPTLRPGCGVAFSVPGPEGEQLVIVQEVDTRQSPNLAEIGAAICRVVAEAHGVSTHEVVLIEARSIPKTRSGKLQRRAAREAYLSGRLAVEARWPGSADRIPVASQAPPRSSEPTTARPEDPSASDIEERIAEILGREIDVDPRSIHFDLPFVDLGLDSASAVVLAGEIEEWLGREIPSTLIWDYPTVGTLAAHLADDAGSRPLLPDGEGACDEPFALVGLACRFPGANDRDAFWKLLCEGGDAIREVPSERWDIDAWFDPDPGVPGKMTTRWGGFLDEIDGFDAGFFGISPREIASMDPQHRILIEMTWEALEDAGIVSDPAVASNVGVFIGISTNDYSLLHASTAAVTDAYSLLGNVHSLAANRISYLLGLGGPSLIVDTACSSSLVALHLACQSMRAGECDSVVVGGVNLIIDPTVTVAFSKGGFMAADGRCKSFDARADGYVRAEGCGVVVLKPLSRALADGDRIYALVRGSAVNNDGPRNGLTAPNPAGQEAVLRSAYAHAGVDTATVSYVEAHGTGTQLGDPIEARALHAALGADRDRPLLMGSVKSNIGHCEPASGMAGLIKTALALHRGEIPPSIHFESPNSHVPFEEFGLRVVRERTPWPEGPRIAGVSSFGFGGANAHVVLECAPEAPERAALTAQAGPFLLPLSARSPEALRATAASWSAWLSEASPCLRDVVSSASLRRVHHGERLPLVFETREELQRQLEQAARAEDTGTGLSPRASDRRLALVFSGQGSQWAGMGAELLASEPVFAQAFSEVEERFAAEGFLGLRSELLAEKASSRLADTEVAQPAIFAVQVALAAWWRSRGVAPAAVVGHSVGEVAAAHVAGALSLEQAVRVVRLRGQLMRGASGRGRMLAVALPETEAAAALEGHSASVSLAAVNGTHSIVLSGEPDALEAIEARLAGQGVSCRSVPVEYAFHSPQMDPFREELVDRLRDLTPRASALPFFSTVTGELHAGESLDASYWGRNLREPVRFAAALRALVDAGFDAFLEVGGHPALSPAIQETLEDLDTSGAIPLVVGSMRRGRPERGSLLASLGSLWAGGLQPRWEQIAPRDGRVISLPAYPWQRDRHWFTPGQVQRSAHRRRRLGSEDGAEISSHDWLEHYLPLSRHTGAHYWETELGLERQAWLGDHRVGEAVVLPAAVYGDLALSAADEAFGRAAHVVEELMLVQALALPESGCRRLQVVATRAGAERATLDFLSRASEAPAETPWTLHAKAELRLARSKDDAPRQATEDLPALRSRCSEDVAVDEFYSALSEAGLCYGPAFRSISELSRGSEEAFARLVVPAATASLQGHRIHPSLLDGAFQVVAAAVGTASATFVPVGLDRLTVLGETPRESFCHARIRATSDERIEADLLMMDDDGLVVAEASGLKLARLESASAGSMGSWLHHVTWRHMAHEAVEAPASGTWLLLDDGTYLGISLGKALEDRGNRCVRVRRGTGFLRLEDALFEVNPSRPEDFHELLQQALVTGHPGCAGVVHLWSLGDPSNPDELPADAAAALCAGTLHMVQALARAGFRDPPQLGLVTRNAQFVPGGDEPVAPVPASLWGLARVIANEHPELNCRRFDLGSTSSEDELQGLIEDLTAPDGEDEVAWRKGGRLASRLIRGLPEPDGTAEPMEPASGRPFRLEIDTPGVLDRLTLRVAQPRSPGPGEIAIRVRAAGLNFKDVLLALGVVPSPLDHGVPLGGECAGTVQAVGEGVENFAPGDEVVALGGFCLASHVTTRACLAVAKPARLSFEQAAALPIVFLTAHRALHTLGRMQRGERVLIHSATGGVGLAAVQLAERAGVEVLATAGTPEKRALLRERGIQQVMDSRTLDFASEILDATEGRGVDLLLNSLSGEAIEKNFESLAPYGRFLEIGIRDIYENKKIGLFPFHKSLAYFSIDLSRLLLERPEELGSALGELMDAFERGDLEPLPTQIEPVSEAAATFRNMARAGHVGKIAFRVDHEKVEVARERVDGFRADASYLITGGLGGLGLTTAGWMAERGARHLLLVGRRAPTAEAAEALDRLRENGVQVEVLAADISDASTGSAVRSALEGIGRPLRGVVHAAGVLDDGILLHQNVDRFREVMAPKIAGADNLDRWTAQDPLDFFVLFSSAATLLGAPGQGNYCAANSFMDALSHNRRQRGQPALSVNWGPWAEVGMAAEASLLGMTSISPELGTRVLGQLLREAPAQVAVMALDMRQWMQLFPQAADTPLLSELARDADSDRQESRPSPVRDELLAMASGPSRAAHLTRYLRERVAAVLGLDITGVAVDQPLTDLGFDSLMALELRNRCEAGLGVRLSPTLIWAHPTVDDLVPELAQRMGVELEEDGEAPEAEAEPEVADERSAEELARALEGQLARLEEADVS